MGEAETFERGESGVTTRVTGRRAVSAVRVDPLVSQILLEDLCQIRMVG